MENKIYQIYQLTIASVLCHFNNKMSTPRSTSRDMSELVVFTK